MPLSRLRLPALILVLAVAPALAQQGLPDSPEARFRALDVNHDGVISKYEYDSDAAFAVMDYNHDGHLSAAELQSILGPSEEAQGLADRRITVADVDGDGKLSDAELRDALQFRFNSLDRNKDGNVDLAELKAGLGIAMLRK